MSLFLTGCSGEISNDYVTITKYKGVEIDKVDADAVSDNDVEAQINSVLQSKSTTTEVTDRAKTNRRYGNDRLRRKERWCGI